jgi:hypothetical protein
VREIKRKESNMATVIGFTIALPPLVAFKIMATAVGATITGYDGLRKRA